MPNADDLQLRRATADEIISEVISGEPDEWLSLPLDVSAGGAARGAQQLWGEPELGPLDGELAWRLRTDDDDSYPLYLSTDFTTAALLFFAAYHPEKREAEKLARRVDRVLLELSKPLITDWRRVRDRANSDRAA